VTSTPFIDPKSLPIEQTLLDFPVSPRVITPAGKRRGNLRRIRRGRTR
jgi:hypothetical protein